VLCEPEVNEIMSQFKEVTNAIEPTLIYSSKTFKTSENMRNIEIKLEIGTLFTKP
jgi:hypothetical protein